MVVNSFGTLPRKDHRGGKTIPEDRVGMGICPYCGADLSMHQSACELNILFNLGVEWGPSSALSSW